MGTENDMYDQENNHKHRMLENVFRIIQHNERMD